METSQGRFPYRNDDECWCCRLEIHPSSDVSCVILENHLLVLESCDCKIACIEYIDTATKQSRIALDDETLEYVWH